jgi:hypothetical protein
VDRALGVLGVPRVVRHHHQRGAAAVELAQQVHHRLAVGAVQVTRRLVGQEYAGRARDRARHRHALLLTAGELRRVVRRAVRHPHPLQRVLHARLPLALRHPAIGERQLHVLVDRQVADQVERLEDEADLPVADLRPLRRGQVLHRLAHQPVDARARGVEEPQDGEERRLPAARRTRDRHELPRLDLQVHVRESVRLHVLRVEDLAHAVEVDQCPIRCCRHGMVWLWW